MKSKVLFAFAFCFVLLLGMFTSSALAASCRGSMCSIEGTPGNDVINGTSGADVICSFDGNDTVYAKGGNDKICGGPGDDYLYGEGGNDILVGEGGSDTVDGGSGTDRAQYPTIAGGSVYVNLIIGDSRDHVDGAKVDELKSIEDLWGGGGEDWFVGNDVNNELIGFGDDDILEGGGGTDRCDGLTGDEDTCTACEVLNGCELP
jgi:Ca2+-binding RTX toxin-like protein